MVISVKRILFQGDSITDMYRVRDLDHYAGCGYATLVSAQLGYENPGERNTVVFYLHNLMDSPKNKETELNGWSPYFFTG